MNSLPPIGTTLESNDINILNMILMAMQVHQGAHGCSRGQILSFLKGRVDAMRYRWDRALLMKVVKILDACIMQKVLKINCGRYFVNDPAGPKGPIIAGEGSKLKKRLDKLRLRRITFRRRLRCRLKRMIKKKRTKGRRKARKKSHKKPEMCYPHRQAKSQPPAIMFTRKSRPTHRSSTRKRRPSRNAHSARSRSGANRRPRRASGRARSRRHRHRGRRKCPPETDSPGLKSLIELQRKVDKERWKERSVACGCDMPEYPC